ncbi:hypothetical protein ACOMHN_016183 [Nucella lapillus]
MKLLRLTSKLTPSSCVDGSNTTKNDTQFKSTTEECASPLPHITKKSTSSSTNLASHIYVLYSLVAMLSGAQIATLWFGSYKLTSLQKQLDGLTDSIKWAEVYSFLISKNLSNLDRDDREAHTRARLLPSDQLLQLWTFVARENAYVGQGQNGEEGQENGSRSDNPRSRRSIVSKETKEGVGKWAWMSNRNPVSF